MSSDSLGDRMKSYEDVFRAHLPIRMPVIIRIDGKAFHTYTASCKRPVDEGLVECMNKTAIELCTQAQGCQLAYVQSDEISLLLTNYQTVDTQSWFDNNLLKITTVAASIAGVTFSMNSDLIWGNEEYQSVSGDEHVFPIQNPAYFDARAFVLPKEDVNNYFLWRQQDATRNSVQMLARSLYSHKELLNKNNSELQEMIFQKGLNWNNVPTSQKRGRCIVKKKVTQPAYNPITKQSIMAERSEWVVDNEIPIFSQNKSYIDKLVYPDRLFKETVLPVSEEDDEFKIRNS